MGPWPMRGLRGGCHGNVRICGKLVASGGRSISHIPALIEGASLVNPVISSLRRFFSTNKGLLASICYVTPVESYTISCQGVQFTV